MIGGPAVRAVAATGGDRPGSAATATGGGPPAPAAASAAVFPALRVLHFLWSGNVGGAERSVYQIVREEARRGEWEVGVAFGRAEGPYAEAVRALGCEVVDLRMRGGADLARALRGVDRIGGYHIHHFHALEPSEIAASVRCPGVARVFTQRGGRADGPVSRRKRMRRRAGGALLRRYFHAVAGNTEHARREVVERYGLHRLPSHLTYNGLDFSLLVPGRDRLAVRDLLGLAPDAPVVGSSGKFKACKRFERLVDLLGVRADLHVLLVGDGPLRGALEARARSLGAGARLHVTGTVTGVSDYLQAMDVFVLPSSAAESFGNSLVEAMSLGLPSVVFADSPGLCEHIEDGVTGFVVHDEAGLASVLERLTAHPDERSRVGRAGAERVRARYTLERMHEAYRALYDSALRERAGGRGRTP